MFGRCDCGAVTIEVPSEPEALTSCNCSGCRRVGGLWAYFLPAEVKVEGPTVGYQRSDKTLTLHHCPTCGCTTHWSAVDPTLQRMGVNMRLVEGFERIRVRHLDGANT